MLPMLSDGWLALGRKHILPRVNKRSRVHSPKQQVVAIATKRNRVVSIGRNSYSKTHPKQSHYARLAGQPKKEYLHAEVAALLRAPPDADTLFVMRFDKQGNPVCAAPCPVCSLAIRLFNPKLKVIHT